MKKLFKTVFLLMFFAFCFGCKKENIGENGVFLSVDDALSDAKKNDKNILVIVTSDGDDELSHDFIENVIKSSEFKTETEAKFSVLYMDFSEATFAKTVVNPDDDKKKQKEAQKFADIMQENSVLASKLYVQNTPAMFVLTKEFYFITEIDVSQKIENFSMLEQLLENQNDKIQAVNQMVSETKHGSVAEKIAAIDKLYENTDLMYRSFLADLIFEVIELDKKNESGLLSKYLLTSADINSSEQFLKGNVDEAVKTYTDICSNEFMLPEHKQQAYYLAAYIMLITGSQDYETCLNLIDMSISVAPDTESAQTIQNLRDYLKNEIMPAQ